ncbi:MAG: leucine--tRNA ligase [Spirochaetota bacterium]|jgi:leucyl-tRNA synthetase|nr:leucine--tRNA ligase [Spirochaetota bacterium]
MSVSEYDFSAIEKKWQNYWEANKTFRMREDPAIPKERRFYCLDMFPYPSSAGLHIGHPEGYTATDIICRYKRMRGYAVLHPMGWDSFGLPAENYAIKTGTHPRTTTLANIEGFRRQIKALGFSYDWDREASTCDPDYFRWTQWIFLQLYNAGLAYQAIVPINFCPSCRTGLANEEVKDGRCERCHTEVVRKDMKQWMLRITAYADRLLSDLDLLDWPEPIKLMQRNWIGRSVGAEVDFAIPGRSEVLTVFTTRPDTLFGATYMCLSPEHPLLDALATEEQRAAVTAYVEAAKNKSDLDRTDLAKEKTGVFLGSYAINPVNNARIPIWVADYVLISYGTGAIMAVPAHDERDFEFAQKFSLPIIEVVSADGKTHGIPKEALTPDGYAVNSGEFDGLSTSECKQKITARLASMGKGKEAVHYKLRDWVFSRQRYWGEPIPLVHCERCGTVALPESALPLTLPEVEAYTPSGTGESPLAAMRDWVAAVCPQCGGSARRETDTMPQWAGSCWYYIRFLDAHNTAVFASPERIAYWLPVDLYIGGAEHAVLHLLYARFWHKFLFDKGFVQSPEPFMRLVNQGLIMGEDGQKMSKSLGNVVNPDEVIAQHGADTLRLYEMFLGPLEMSKPWNMSGIMGVRRFLERALRLFDKPIADGAAHGNVEEPEDHARLRHRTIRKVTEDIENLSFNTAISALMVFVTELTRRDTFMRADAEALALLLSPFAPHLGEELWALAGHDTTLAYEKWPEFNPALTVQDTVEVVFQVNGKVRDKALFARNSEAAILEAAARRSERVAPWIAGREIVKIICVPDKLVNIVVRG